MPAGITSPELNTESAGIASPDSKVTPESNMAEPPHIIPGFIVCPVGKCGVPPIKLPSSNVNCLPSISLKENPLTNSVLGGNVVSAANITPASNICRLSFTPSPSRSSNILARSKLSPNVVPDGMPSASPDGGMKKSTASSNTSDLPTISLKSNRPENSTSPANGWPTLNPVPAPNVWWSVKVWV